MGNSRKNIALRALAWALVLLWMGVIYAFSAQTAVESDATSGDFIQFFARIFGSRFTALSPGEQEAFIASWQGAARVVGHMGAFGILGFLLGAALYASFPAFPFGRLVGLALACTAVYALGDETHQLFVEGRAFQLSDIVWDSLGGLAGALGAVWLLGLIGPGRRKKRENAH